MYNIFDPGTLYFPDDKEMRVFGSVDKLAQWRHRGRGPAYVKAGRSITYLGADLNVWLWKRRIVTQCMEEAEKELLKDPKMIANRELNEHLSGVKK